MDILSFSHMSHGRERHGHRKNGRGENGGRSNGWSVLLASCVIGCTLFLAGCGSVPLNVESVNVSLTPEQIRLQPDNARGNVIWGGVIVSGVNLADRTQFEVLAYPLDRYQRPLTGRPSIGRFLLQSPDYIETANYAPGREVTAIGSLQGLTKGEVGEATFQYPTVTLNDVHLWHTDNSHEKTRFIFGINLTL